MFAGPHELKSSVLPSGSETGVSIRLCPATLELQESGTTATKHRISIQDYCLYCTLILIFILYLGVIMYVLILKICLILHSMVQLNNEKCKLMSLIKISNGLGLTISTFSKCLLTEEHLNNMQ